MAVIKMRKVLKGFDTSPGVARNKIRVTANRQEGDNFQKGDILVTRIADLTMIMMMSKVGAIICEIGNLTSHPLIISRQIVILCVVGVSNAAEILRNIMKAEVGGRQENDRIIDSSIVPIHLAWMDKYTESVQRFYQGTDLKTFELFAVLHFHPLYSDLWIRKVISLIKKFKKLRLSIDK